MKKNRKNPQDPNVDPSQADELLRAPLPANESPAESRMESQVPAAAAAFFPLPSFDEEEISAEDQHDERRRAEEQRAEAHRAAEERIRTARAEAAEAAAKRESLTAAQQSLDDAQAGGRRTAAVIIRDFRGEGSGIRLNNKPLSEVRPSAAAPDAPVDQAAAGVNAEVPAKSVRPPVSQIIRPVSMSPLEAAEIRGGHDVPAAPFRKMETDSQAAPVHSSEQPAMPQVLIQSAAKTAEAEDGDQDSPVSGFSDNFNRIAGRASKRLKTAADSVSTLVAMKARREPASAAVPGLSAARLHRFCDDRKAGLLLLTSALLQIVLQLAWLAFPDGLWGLDKNSFGAAVIAAMLSQLFLVLIPSLAVLGIFHIPFDRLSGEKPLSFPLGLLSVVIGVPAGLCLHALNNLLIYAASRLDVLVPERMIPQFSSPDGPYAWPAALLVFVLAPAVFEELMFRGIIQPEMSRGGHRLPALILSSVGFALFHNDPLFWLAPLGAGFILGLLRSRTGSLYSPILTHAAMNLSTVFISPLLPRFTTRLVLEYGAAGSSILYANLITAIVAGVLLIPLLVLLGSLTEETQDLFSGKSVPKHTAGRKQRRFYVSRATEPADYSRLPLRSSLSPLLDWFYWTACLILLFFLLSNYFISV